MQKLHTSFSIWVMKKLNKKLHSDYELIQSLGGTTALAEILGYSVQRVQNWVLRGIPPLEKLKHSDLLLVKSPNNREHSDNRSDQ